MFAGLMGLKCPNNSLFHHCEVTEGGRASGTAGSSGRKRLHRRPGYVRGDQARLQGTACGREEEEGEAEEAEEEEDEEEEEESNACIRNGKSACHADVIEASGVARRNLPPTAKEPSMNQHSYDDLTCRSLRSRNRLCSGPLPCSPVHSSPACSTSSQNGLRWSWSPAPRSSPEDSFNSSFSFIQQSLNNSQRTVSTTTPAQEPEPLIWSQKAPDSPLTKPDTTFSSKHPAPVQPPPSSAAAGNQVQREELSLGGTFWRERRWGGKEEPSCLPDAESRSLDIEVTSSLSVDSDTASASSFTSGYESATPAPEQGWDNPLKKYEAVLQDCLQNNRAHTKIESMMLKLQRLQQKAILDDDYDAAERFGKKLEELCRERGALKLGLPSRQPSVAMFLQRLTQVVHSALRRADCSQCSRAEDEAETREGSDSPQGPLQRRDRLIQERRQVEEEMAALQLKLAELRDRSRCLEQQIQQEEQQVEDEEMEGSALRNCTVAQLRDMSRTLQDLVTSKNRTQISVAPPASMLRLQEQEQALNLSIKEATAKVVMSQRLGSSLRRKVSETETQLLALHEAKLAAISGNDFGSAKELKAEMKAVYLERDRLEALAKRLHNLSSGSSQELARMKEQRQQLRQELERREAQHESRLKENTSKYMELLEDRLHSGCPGLERIWEADLEACHLFLRGLQLRTPSCSGADIDIDLPAATSFPPTPPCTKEEEDCAMLTALGGRWCPEANLQNSEFTKKLEEFLFCMEENHPEDACSEAEAADLTERCELISDRLMALEDELQTAILNRDQSLAQCLENEVQTVKAALQAMLTQLEVEEEEEEETEEVNEFDDLLKNGTEEEDEEEEEEGQEEEEEEEDQYFSDSWDI
ncbi:disrupted in schizophrenia 1 protein isoform X3 [Cololabis saira]|uniref:disrupted in schizophrenia 1 protein isoform X3 n=1 Tax=Cololabis saira TaxID=129043 RepID=UPI002AD3FAA9|nr:disrupted in schizophrenia 1 protein isoform X3 [Cololabis saira]